MSTKITITNAGTNISATLDIYTNEHGYWTFFQNASLVDLKNGYIFTGPVGTTSYQVRDTGNCGAILELTCDISVTTTTSTSSSTTTTTTTTTGEFSCIEFCVEGIYEEGDGVHPDGGTINYIDCQGNSAVLTEIFNGTVTHFMARSIVNHIGTTSVSICS